MTDTTTTPIPPAPHHPPMFVPRKLRGVTRTVRMTILDGEGTAVDLTQARSVTVTISLDNYSRDYIVKPAFSIGGDGNNVVSFPWYADQQKKPGRYTFDLNADFGDRNESRVNWHSFESVELVEYGTELFPAPAPGDDPQTLEVDDVIELVGTSTMNGVGMSAYEIWLSHGNEGSEADFLASLKGDQGDPGADGEPGVSGGMLFPLMDFDSTTGVLTITGLPQEVSRIRFDETTGELIIRLSR